MRKLGHGKLPQISFFLRKLSSSFAFLKMVFGLGDQSAAWLELPFSVTLLSSHWPSQQNPWEEPHPGVEVAWGDALVEALALRVAFCWISHLGFSSGFSPLFRCHVPHSRNQ